MSDTDSSLEEVDFPITDWVNTEIIDRAIKDCFTMVKFRYYVDRYTRRSYLKFRVKNWRKGWDKFLMYIETQRFEQGLISYLVKKGFDITTIQKTFLEFRTEFFETVRGEEKILEKEND